VHDGWCATHAARQFDCAPVKSSSVDPTISIILSQPSPPVDLGFVQSRVRVTSSKQSSPVKATGRWVNYASVLIHAEAAHTRSEPLLLHRCIHGPATTCCRARLAEWCMFAICTYVPPLYDHVK
jgi:hypothetical protein